MTATFYAKHPEGRSGKRWLSPFFFVRRMPNSSGMTLPSLIIDLRLDCGNDFYPNRGMLRLWFGDKWGASCGVVLSLPSSSLGTHILEAPLRNRQFSGDTRQVSPTTD